ncbi:MAG: type VI secretion system tip protein VgrG [Planctomycetes bacterium]|nr:type VI secretion system tip protein VgrG [Planctomycetota bacterium]
MPEIAITQVMQFHSDAVEDGDLLVTKLEGDEAINRPYEFRLELASTRTDIDFSEMIRKTAWIGIKQGVQLAGQDKRAATTLKIHGVIQSFEQVGKELELVKYRAVLVPRLKRLALAHQSRIFQEKSVPEIVKSICQEYDVEVDTGKLGSHKARDYVVQYEESDLDFIHRWMEHEGIFYYFVQTEDREKMVLADSAEGYGTLQGNAKFSYKPSQDDNESRIEAADTEEAAEDWFKEEVVTAIAARTNLLPKKVILNDYNWDDPDTGLECEADVHGDGVGIVYRYNSHYHTKEDGDRLAAIRAEEIQCREHVFTGRSDCRGFRAGMVFELQDHYRDSTNNEYLLTEVRHRATQAVALGGNAGGGASYSNSFVAIPKSKKFRPVFSTPWPQIKGVMHAKVDGADNSTPYAQLDDKGRYKIKMPIDRGGGGDGQASKFVRKSEPYAGPDQGMHFPLLKNSEVILTHVDGDPDRPVIAGAMFNSKNSSVVGMTNSTQNVIATPGGSKFVLDDTVGSPFINLKTKDSKLDMKFDGTDGSENMCFKSTDKNEVKLHSGDENLYIKSAKDDTYLRMGKGGNEAAKSEGSVTVTGGENGFYLSTKGQWNQYAEKDANIIIKGKENKQVGDASDWTIKGTSAEYKYGDHFTFKAALTYGIEIGFTADFKAAGGIAIAVGASFSIKAGATVTMEASASLTVKSAKSKEYVFDGLTNVANKDREDSVAKNFTLATKQKMLIKAKEKVTLQGNAPFPPPDPSLKARMAAWATSAMASVKSKSSTAPPPPPPPPVPGPPPLPRTKIEVDAQKILLLFDTTTMLRLDNSGITLKCKGSKLIVGPTGITAKPMVQGG